MAIVTETYELNGRQFTRTYSDANRYVVRDGVSYSEANDLSEFGRTYTEGDLLPEKERTVDPDDATAEDYEAALSELGVSV